MEKFEVVAKPMQQDLTAVQFQGKPDNAKDGTFAGFPTREDSSRQPIQLAVLVPTASGGTPAFPGDWIVSDTDGELSVVPNDYFFTHYKSSGPVAPAAPAVHSVAPATHAPAPVSKFTPQQIAAAVEAAKRAEAAKRVLS